MYCHLSILNKDGRLVSTSSCCTKEKEKNPTYGWCYFALVRSSGICAVATRLGGAHISAKAPQSPEIKIPGSTPKVNGFFFGPFPIPPSSFVDIHPLVFGMNCQQTSRKGWKHSFLGGGDDCHQTWEDETRNILKTSFIKSVRYFLFETDLDPASSRSGSLTKMLIFFLYTQDFSQKSVWQFLSYVHVGTSIQIQNPDPDQLRSRSNSPTYSVTTQHLKMTNQKRDCWKIIVIIRNIQNDKTLLWKNDFWCNWSL